MATKVVRLYSRNYYADDFGVTDQAETRRRSEFETNLQAVVLPLLDIRFLAVSSMEIHCRSSVYIRNADVQTPQFQGRCSLRTP